MKSTVNLTPSLAVSRPRVRLVALLALTLGLLAACGDGSTGGTASGSGSGAATGATEVSDPFPRTVRHAMGETEIPAKPERVVVLDTGELDSVTAFGITPVGAVRAPVEDGLLDYLQDQTESTKLVGTIAEVNLEAVAALRPDLILSSKLRHEAIYNELSQIAPTVFTETVGVVWKHNLQVHAKALGFEDEAAKKLADYEERADRLGQKLQEEGGQLPTVSIVRFLPAETRLYQKASFIGTILQDIGLPRPPSQDANEFAAEISAEQLEQANGDVIFSTHYGPADDTTKGELTSNPLWQNLTAVKEGDAYEVPDDYWMLGIGIQAANLVLDDIEKKLLDE